MLFDLLYVVVFICIRYMPMFSYMPTHNIIAHPHEKPMASSMGDFGKLNILFCNSMTYGVFICVMVLLIVSPMSTYWQARLCQCYHRRFPLSIMTLKMSISPLLPNLHQSAFSSYKRYQCIVFLVINIQTSE